MSLSGAESRRVIAGSEQVHAGIARVAAEIDRTLSGTIILVGIREGGLPVLERVAKLLRANHGRSVIEGSVEIAFYRDDASTLRPQGKIGRTMLPAKIENQHLVLVDDILQTGRTVRAAIDELFDHGRPSRIWLASLVDRGDRELPIQADFVGLSLTEPDAWISKDFSPNELTHTDRLRLVFNENDAELVAIRRQPIAEAPTKR